MSNRFKKSKKKARENAVYTGKASIVENGETTMMSGDMVDEILGWSNDGETIRIIAGLARATGMRGEGFGLNPAQRLRVYDKYVPKLIKLYFANVEACGGLSKELDRATNNALERNGKRWDRDEDDALIDLVTEEDMSIAQIAITMGRTPQAIQTRVSHLVGIKRLSSDVAGRFKGTLDGVEVDGYIDGTVTREKGRD